MPIYEYRCSKCGKDFEMLILRRDEVVSCPQCGALEVSKKMSLFGFKSGGDKGAASSRVASTKASSGCATCSATSCASCH